MKANASLYLVTYCYQNNRKTQKKHIWCAGTAIQAVQMEEVGRLAKEPQLDSSTCAEFSAMVCQPSFQHLTAMIINYLKIWLKEIVRKSGTSCLESCLELYNYIATISISCFETLYFFGPP